MTRILIALLIPLSAIPAQDTPPASAEIRASAERAYLFAYPLVLMEFTRRAALERPALGGVASINQFTHAPRFPDASFRQVIRPNADTLYSSAWLDLSKEPVLLEVPDTAGRYYLIQLMDAWTETFSVPGKRTTGTGHGWFAVVGPGWQGKLPDRAQRIDAPTNMVWMLGRVQTNNASDYENVHAIQKGFRVMPLHLYPDGWKTPPPAAPRSRPQVASGPPPVALAHMNAVAFFRLFADLLKDNPPHSADHTMLADLARIGIVPGRPFNPDALGDQGLQALEQGAQAASARLSALHGTIGAPGKNGWSGGGGKVGRYGTDYLVRAVVARIGLGALPPEDAVYLHCHQDRDGRPLDGSHRYRLHFDKDAIPPVRAFWSVTMYSADGYFVPNPINRFAIGDRDPLVRNPDGSLDLYIQHPAPESGKQPNWLPAPNGQFNLSLRMYWPKPEVLDARWSPPPVLRED